MKKAVIFVVFAMLVIGFCSAQNANDAQRIVGTWVSEDGGTTVVFNANGTGTIRGNNFSYGISADGKIWITNFAQSFSDENRNSNYFGLFMSPDSKRIIISGRVYLKK